MLTLAVVTISDRCFKGEREDKSGKVVQEVFERTSAKLVSYEVLPDEPEKIREHLIKLADEMRIGIVVTTGGTGFSKRDVTPEVTRSVIEREVPGLCEIMRIEGYKKTPLALLSRGVAGLRGMTLIINLPGSTRGVSESLEIILPVLEHGLGILKDTVLHEEKKI